MVPKNMNMLPNRVHKSQVLDWTRFMSLYFSLPFNTRNFTTDRWILILSSGLGYESYNLCKMITINNQAHSLGSRAAFSLTTWALSASNCSSSAKEYTNECQYSIKDIIMSLEMYFFYTFVYLEISKQTKKLAPICNKYVDDVRRFFFICSKELGEGGKQ